MKAVFDQFGQINQTNRDIEGHSITNHKYIYLVLQQLYFDRRTLLASGLNEKFWLAALLLLLGSAPPRSNAT